MMIPPSWNLSHLIPLLLCSFILLFDFIQATNSPLLSLKGTQLEGFTVGGDCNFANNGAFTSLTKQSLGSWGFIASKQPIIHDQGWEAVIRFEIQGDVRKIGGQGLAFWYVKSLKSLRESSVPNEPSVFGMSNRWNGLGIFLEHDRQAGPGNSMNIKAVWNNERVVYNPDAQQPDQNLHFASCKRDLRNAPGGPSMLRIRYSRAQRKLFVSIAIGATGKEEQCIEYGNDIEIPVGMYVGISGANSMISGSSPDRIVLHSVQFNVLQESALEKTMEKPILQSHSLSSPSPSPSPSSQNSQPLLSASEFDIFANSFKASISALQTSMSGLNKQLPQMIRSASQEIIEGMTRKIVSESQSSHSRTLANAEERIVREMHTRISRLESLIGGEQNEGGKALEKLKMGCWVLVGVQVGILLFVWRLYSTLNGTVGGKVVEKKFI